MVINIDITKAKEVHKEELRIERREKFKELDVLYMRAQEAGEDTSDIVAKKQLLRDATKSVDNKGFASLPSRWNSPSTLILFLDKERGDALSPILKAFWWSSKKLSPPNSIGFFLFGSKEDSFIVCNWGRRALGTTYLSFYQR